MQTFITVHVLVKNQNKYLVVQRASNRSNPNYWTCITGHIREFENAEDTALRELKEEMNLEGQIKYIGKPFTHINNDIRWIILAYLVEVEDISSLKPDYFELKAYKWIEKDDELVYKNKALNDTFRLLNVI